MELPAPSVASAGSLCAFAVVTFTRTGGATSAPLPAPARFLARSDEMLLFDVDGAVPNQVDEIETQALPTGPGNPHGGGFAMQQRVVAHEAEAWRSLDARAGRRRVASIFQRTPHQDGAQTRRRGHLV